MNTQGRVYLGNSVWYHPWGKQLRHEYVPGTITAAEALQNPGKLLWNSLRLDGTQLYQLRLLVSQVVNLLETPEKLVCVCCGGEGKGNVHVYTRVENDAWTLFYDGGGYILSQRSPVLPEALAVLSVLGEVKP